jgi:hypothetical protein
MVRAGSVERPLHSFGWEYIPLHDGHSSPINTDAIQELHDAGRGMGEGFMRKHTRPGLARAHRARSGPLKCRIGFFAGELPQWLDP